MNIKERNTMDFLINHWHCILPAIILVVALMIMNRKG